MLAPDRLRAIDAFCLPLEGQIARTNPYNAQRLPSLMPSLNPLGPGGAIERFTNYWNVVPRIAAAGDTATRRETARARALALAQQAPGWANFADSPDEQEAVVHRLSRQVMLNDYIRWQQSLNAPLYQNYASLPPAVQAVFQRELLDALGEDFTGDLAAFEANWLAPARGIQALTTALRAVNPYNRASLSLEGWSNWVFHPVQIVGGVPRDAWIAQAATLAENLVRRWPLAASYDEGVREEAQQLLAQEILVNDFLHHRAQTPGVWQNIMQLPAAQKEQLIARLKAILADPEAGDFDEQITRLELQWDVAAQEAASGLREAVMLLQQASTLADFLRRARVLLDKLETGYTRHLRYINQVPGLRGTFDGISAEDFRAIIAQVENIQERFYNETGDMNYCQVIREIQVLNTNASFQRLAPEVLKILIRRLGRICADYAAIEQDINAREYAAAAQKARALLEKPELLELLPVRMHKYLVATTQTYDCYDALKAGGDTQNVFAQYLVSEALQTIYQDLLSPPGVGPDWQQAMLPNLQTILTHLYALPQAQSAHHFLESAQQLMVAVRANPWAQGGGGDAGFLANLQSAVDMVKAIGTQASAQTPDLQAIVMLAGQLQDNPVLQKVLPPFVQQLLKDTRDINVAIAHVQSLAQRKQYVAMGVYIHDQMANPEFARKLPEALKPYVSAVADTLHFMHTLSTGSPEVREGAIATYLESASLGIIYHHLFEQREKPHLVWGAMKPNVQTLMASGYDFARAQNLDQLLDAARRMCGAIEANPFLHESAELKETLANVQAIIGDIEGLLRELESGNVGQAIQILKSTEQNPTYQRYFPQAIKTWVTRINALHTDVAVAQELMGAKPPKYDAAILHFRQVLASEDFEAMLPEELKEYVRALVATYDTFQALADNCEEPERVLAEQLGQQALETVYRRAFLREDEASDWLLVKHNVVNSLGHLHRLRRAQTVGEFLEHLQLLTSEMKANVRIAPEGRLHYFLQGLEDLSRKVLALKKEAARPSVDVSRILPLCAELNTNPLFQTYAPTVVKEWIGTLHQGQANVLEITKAVTERRYVQAAALARAFTNDPALAALLPEWAKQYVAAFDDVLLHLQAIATSSRQDVAKSFLETQAAELAYKLIWLRPEQPSAWEEIRPNLQACVDQVVVLSQAQTVKEYLRAASDLFELSKGHATLFSGTFLQPKLIDLREISTILLHAAQALDAGNMDDLLRYAVELRHIPTFAQEVPKPIVRWLEDAEKIAVQVRTVQKLVDDNEYAAAVRVAMELLDSQAMQDLTPDWAVKYLQGVVKTYRFYKDGFSVAADAQDFDRAFVQWIRDPAIQAIFKARFNAKGTIPEEDFITNMQGVFQGFRHMQAAGSSEEFLQAAEEVLRFVRACPVFTAEGRVAKGCEDLEGIAGILVRAKSAFNEGRFSDVIRVLQELNGNLLFQQLPVFATSLVPELSEINEHIVEVEQHRQNRQYTLAIRSLRQMCEGPAIRRLLPKYLHSFIEEFVAAQRAYDEAVDHIVTNRIPEANAAIQQHLNSPIARKVFGGLMGEQAYEDFLKHAGKAADSITNLAKVLSEKGDPRYSRIAGLIHWAGTEREFLASFSQYEIFKPYAQMAEIRLFDNLIALFARRGPRGEAPTLGNITAREQFWLTYHIERYFFESSQPAEPYEWKQCLSHMLRQVSDADEKILKGYMDEHLIKLQPQLVNKKQPDGRIVTTLVLWNAAEYREGTHKDDRVKIELLISKALLAMAGEDGRGRQRDPIKVAFKKAKRPAEANRLSVYEYFRSYGRFVLNIVGLSFGYTGHFLWRVMRTAAQWVAKILSSPFVAIWRWVRNKKSPASSGPEVHLGGWSPAGSEDASSRCEQEENMEHADALLAVRADFLPAQRSTSSERSAALSTGATPVLDSMTGGTLTLG